MPVEELPSAWNRAMKELLGIEPSNDREGCLQDVHWSEGLFGYFPSYALGHLISAQISETIEGQLGPIESLLAAGDDAALGHWLKQRVYPLGAVSTPWSWWSRSQAPLKPSSVPALPAAEARTTRRVKKRNEGVQTLTVAL